MLATKQQPQPTNIRFLNSTLQSSRHRFSPVWTWPRWRACDHHLQSFPPCVSELLWPSFHVWIRCQSLKQRLGKSNIQARLGRPVGALMRGGAVLGRGGMRGMSRGSLRGRARGGVMRGALSLRGATPPSQSLHHEARCVCRWVTWCACAAQRSECPLRAGPCEVAPLLAAWPCVEEAASAEHLLAEEELWPEESYEEE